METSPLTSTLRIALVGDYNSATVAHQAIPLAIDDAAAVLELTADYDWLPTKDIKSPEDLVGYDAIWVVPGSPMKTKTAHLSPFGMRVKMRFRFLAPAAVFSMRSLSMPVTFWAGATRTTAKPHRAADWSLHR